ncbi:MAG TPA: DUF3662 and FHA domain-containing protein [Ktedonobacteraceae bacterium]|nr:DUF3662 and FHA domain-containing protein [Ktedonobacteraceae bacterium]
MTTRQNPLSKFESFMQRIVEGPFAFLFPARLEPAQVRRQLELKMEDNLVLQGEGRRLAPNLYTIYLSSQDYQQLSQSFSYHATDWQNHLVEVARQRHYTLKTMPILRLEEDSDLRVGRIRIEAELADKQHFHPNANAGPSVDGGLMATKAISPDQLAQLRSQLASAQQSGVHNMSEMGSLAPGHPGAPVQGLNSNPDYPSYPGHPPNPSSSLMPPVPPQAAPGAINMPQAALSIQLPQAGEQLYRIEKPVVKIGRQLNNDIIVEDKRVSRYHAQIKFQPDGQFAIFDLGSTNGITINGTPNQRHHILRNGDCFTIGSYDFYFQRM